MAEPFLGEMSFFANNFAPEYWAYCEGQILPISVNQALYSIIGPSYGGNGRTTFALPNMEGRAPLHWGTGPGLTPRVYAEFGGSSEIVLHHSQMPLHTHQISMLSDRGSSAVASSDDFLAIGFYPTTNAAVKMYSVLSSPAQMSTEALSTEGGSLAHTNIQPSLVMNCCIALDGIYPSRN